MTETRSQGSTFDSVLKWVHAGFPEGVPQKDYFALLALLKRSLTEDEVVRAAKAVLKSNDGDDVTEAEVRAAIAQIIAKEPNPEEIHQVASRLASVGWPLAASAG